MSMMIITTVIANETAQVLNMKLVDTNDQLYFVDYATVDRGGEHTMIVDYNDTYQEFFLGVDSKGKQLILSSDECCDHKRITIKEVDGEFDVEKEAREQWRISDDTCPRKPAQVQVKKIAKCCQFGNGISWARSRFQACRRKKIYSLKRRRRRTSPE